MASKQVNDKRQKFLIEAIKVQEELVDFVGPKQLNDLEARYLRNSE